MAFITGAARGQGRTEALRLAAEGADIVAFDICAPIPDRDMVPAATPDDLAETERCVMEMGRRALAVVGDTRDFTDLQGAVDAARTKFGGIDVVIANAGTIGGNALAHEISENDWQTTLGINLLGVWHNVKAALPGMIAAGRLKSNPLLDPGDIASAVLWLASDEAAFVTGVTLPVDMGAGLQ